jgi:hypothetical protein
MAVNGEQSHRDGPAPPTKLSAEPVVPKIKEDIKMIPRKVGRVRSHARRRMRPSEAPPSGAEASAGPQSLFGDPEGGAV